MIKILKIIGLLILGVVPGIAEDAKFISNYTTNKIFLAAGFIPDSSRIMVGEPLFIAFVVSNRADQPFQFYHVQDEIFRFDATNAAGRPVKKFGMGGSGPLSQVTVRPDKTYTTRLFLNKYCRFDEPGDYTVACSCDFGYFSNYTNLLGRSIVTVFKLTVLPFDSKRLAEIIDAWGHVVETNGALFEAAQALGTINDPRTIPYLAVLATKSSDISWYAVYMLARYTNNASADALAISLKYGEDHVASLAGTALRESHQSDRAACVFLPALTNSDVNLRIQAARAVGWTGSERAFDPLCALLQDESNSVRYVAAQAIGRLGDSRSFAVLTNCLSNSDFALRIAALKGLVALGRPLQAAWVTPMILSGGENVQTYYDAMQLLQRYGGDQAAPGLASCLHFDDPSLRHPHNMRLLLALESVPNGPKYYYKWHCDDRDGTEQELADNRQILSELKAWLNKHRLNNEKRI